MADSPPPAEMPLALPLQKRAHLPASSRFYIVQNAMTDGVRDIIATNLDEHIADAIVAAVNERDSLRDSLQASQVAEQMARDDVRELRREVANLRMALGVLRNSVCGECAPVCVPIIDNALGALHPQASERGA